MLNLDLAILHQENRPTNGRVGYAAGGIPVDIYGTKGKF
jgi:hypothetical protein